MIKQKETVINVWANENADSHLFEFVLRESEGENKLDKIVSALTEKGFVVKTAEWFITKELKSKTYGKLKYKEDKPVKGTINLMKFIK
ncbi:MAG: hypothetical protein QG594_2163 [Bacteroidota bacterium]|nr:hypothetical protein [Bacteroidota bacterium]